MNNYKTPAVWFLSISLLLINIIYVLSSLRTSQTPLHTNVNVRVSDIKHCLETKVLSDAIYPASCVDVVETASLETPPYPPTQQPMWYKHKEATKKYNLLFLQSWFHMTKTMDRNFVQLYNAAQRSPLTNITELWGYDWSDWLPKNVTQGTSGENVVVNVKRKFPNIEWDAIVIEADRGHAMPEIEKKLARFNVAYHHELYCKQYGKCENPWDVPYANIFLMSYANSLPGIMHFVTPESNKYAEKLFVHVPHGADRDLFYRPPEEERNTPVLFAGKVNGLYPLRIRLQALINNGTIPRNLTAVRKHPGYHEMGTPQNPDWNGTDAATLQTIDYANNLKDAKILLVTRSTRHYALRKYTEGALAGCLLIGNIPQ